MNPYELLIQDHAVPLLEEGETIESKARVYTGGFSQRFYVAAATPRRIILVEMKSNLLRSGEAFTIGLNNLSARIPGQEHFVSTIEALYSRYQAEASDATSPASTTSIRLCPELAIEMASQREAPVHEGECLPDCLGH